MIAELLEDEKPLSPHQAVENNNSKSNNKKYHDPAYDDKTIEGLMSYFLQCVERY